MSFKENAIVKMANAKFYIKKNSPEILVGAGIATLIGSLVYTVIGTLNTGVEVTNAVCELDEIENDDSLMEEERRKKKHGIYIHAGLNIARNYAPAVTLATVSAGCLIGSNAIMRRRAFSLAAAYSALDTTFSDYRTRVINEYGEDVDKKMRYGLTTKEVEVEQVDDETGEVVKTKATVTEAAESATNIWYKHQYELSDGTVIVNPNWQPNKDLNATFVLAQIAWFNGCLSRGEHVWQDDIYKELGIPVDGYRQEAHVLGWTPDKNGEKYIKCRLYNKEESGEFISNDDGDLLLAFNPDGMLYYK
jgi:hypothetical protein